MCELKENVTSHVPHTSAGRTFLTTFFLPFYLYLGTYSSLLVLYSFIPTPGSRFISYSLSHGLFLCPGFSFRLEISVAQTFAACCCLSLAPRLLAHNNRNSIWNHHPVFLSGFQSLLILFCSMCLLVFHSFLSVWLSIRDQPSLRPPKTFHCMEGHHSFIMMWSSEVYALICEVISFLLFFFAQAFCLIRNQDSQVSFCV